MPKCIVIGGGISGLSSAVYLSESGVEVEVIEASPKLGGRAYSFLEKNQNTIVDNGQHVLMGCYNHTLEYLTKINSINTLSFQKKLSINYIEKGGRQYQLESSGKLYPFNLIIGLLKYKAITFKDRSKIIGLFKSILFANSKKYENKTVYDWLIFQKQSNRAIKYFWDMLVVSIMNTTANQASAQLFISTLRKVFLNGNRGSKLVIPNSGLSEVFCENASKFIEDKNGKIHFSERVIELKYENDKIISVITNKNIYSNFDFVITSVPFYSLLKIYPKNSLNRFAEYFSYAPIVTAHLWLRNDYFENEFYGFLDSKIHWLFNRQTHISLITSNAEELTKKSNEDILKIFTAELNKYFPKFSTHDIRSHKIIKEKRATFIPSNTFENIRSEVKSDFRNLIFAGDWTNTGLPSTIEGAVKSGKNANTLIMAVLSK